MTGPIYPKGDHAVRLADAAAWTGAFRSKNPNAVKGWMFDRSAFDAILKQPGCCGIRIYRALKEGAEHVVLVGTDSAGNDMLPSSVNQAAVVMEVSWPCPPLCGANSALNG